MSLFEGFERLQLVKVGPNLRERAERCITATQHKAMIARLQRFRERLERDLEPEPWTVLDAPMVLLLSDLCDALELNQQERASVLGAEGIRALVEILESRPVPRSHADLNERQVKALTHARRHGSINNRQYRDVCPGVSAETLRLDLIDLVSRGLLVKNGANRGRFYTPAT